MALLRLAALCKTRVARTAALRASSRLLLVVPTNNPRWPLKPSSRAGVLLSLSPYYASPLLSCRLFSGILKQEEKHPLHRVCCSCVGPRTVSNVISMDDRTSKGSGGTLNVRDRRYAIRYPFAADAEFLDLETGTRSVGVTTDISMGGCFVCTSKPLPLKTRVRVTFRHKEQTVEALGIIRIVKPRIGVGVEFLDVEPPYDRVLVRWIEHLRKSR